MAVPRMPPAPPAELGRGVGPISSRFQGVGSFWLGIGSAAEKRPGVNLS